MARKDLFVGVRPFFAHALIATAAVVLVPLIAVFGLIALLEPDPPILASTLLGIVLAIVLMAIGTVFWNRRGESADIGFSDLMLWRWNRRRVAEAELLHGARLLGLDRSGRPIDDVRISPDQQLKVLKDLTAALESKDPYTHGHSQRVERHTYRTAAAMGLSADDIEDLRTAAALHDVGKIRVPDRILRKAGALNGDERAIVEEHSIVGAWMVSSVGNADVIGAVRHHHERWDGTGYPDGLAGHDIPLFARVIAVADAFDAITSTRPYRASSARQDAVDALRAGSGSQFDPNVVDAFIDALPSRIPVAAGLFILLGGPNRIFRQLAMWFRRLGAGSLTPAAGAAGAAIVLGASIFTPSITDGDASFGRKTAEARAAENTADTAETGDQVEGKRVKNEPKKRRDVEKDKADREPRSRDRDVKERSGGSGAQNIAAPPANDGNKGSDKGNGGGGGAGTAAPPVDPPDPSPTTPATPEPDEPDDDEDEGENPNDANDGCDNDGNAGKGNDDNCN